MKYILRESDDLNLDFPEVDQTEKEIKADETSKLFEIRDGVLTRFLGGHTVLSVEIPEGVTKIASRAFFKKPWIRTVVFPSTLQEIGDEAFFHCNNLIEINLPDSVTKIGESSFNGCIKVEKIKLSKGLTEIPAYAFAGLALYSWTHGKDKVEVVIPSNIKTIGFQAFLAVGLEKIILEEGVESIKRCAFKDAWCSYISLPDSIKNFETDDFLDPLCITYCAIWTKNPYVIDKLATECESVWGDPVAPRKYPVWKK